MSWVIPVRIRSAYNVFSFCVRRPARQRLSLLWLISLSTKMALECLEGGKMSDKGKIVIISGPSAAGKGMVVQVLIDKYSNYETVVQTTSRKRRDGETEAYTYNFVSAEEFEDGISKGEYLEYGNYAGNYYGTSKKVIYEKIDSGINVVLEGALETAAQLKQQCKEAVLVFIIPPNADILSKRLFIREQDEGKTKARLLVYEKEMYSGLRADLIIVNDDVEQTVRELVKALDNSEYARQLYEENVDRVVRLKKELLTVNKKVCIQKPYRGIEPYIFISYAHADSKNVFDIINNLQSAEYRVWYDEGIDPGTEWDENIAVHVEKCGYFIALISENYLASSNCKDELNYARELEKPRLLVYLEDVQLPGGMRMRLSRLQAIHKYKYVSETAFMQKLFETKGLEACCEGVYPIVEENHL